MKYIGVLIAFIVVTLGIVAFILSNNQSKLESKRSETNAEQKNEVVKADPKSVTKQEAKAVAPKVAQKVEKTKVESTDPDVRMRKEAQEGVGEIKNAVESINKELPKSKPVGNNSAHAETKTIPENKTEEADLTTQDFKQMTVENLNKYLEKTVKENYKIETLNALGDKKADAKGSLGSVLAIMNTGSNLERAYAAKAVGNISKDDKSALDQLITVLKTDKDDNVRKEAVRSIGEFSLAKDQVKELEAIMLTEKNEHVKSKLQITINKFNLKE